jgi:N-acetylmuramoyl-L-alanine amidase
LEPKHSLWGYPSDLNLEWQKENSVILLEDNFKDTYQGLTLIKSLIGLTILQERI